MDSELDGLRKHSPNGAAHCPNEPIHMDYGDRLPNGDSHASESNTLLQQQAIRENGEVLPFVHEAEAQSETPPNKFGAVCRIVDELNKNVFWKVKLWMIFILLLLIIIAVILISLTVCSAIHEDEDEKFDPSLFNVPQHFNGSFKMPNMVFTEELFNLSSDESQKLAADLQDKLSDLYRSSTALGRYFSKSEISAFRNGSVISEYKLSFVLPEEELELLRRFVVSREMVYNVFRQFLFDQETPQSDPAYIDPVSLVMF